MDEKENADFRCGNLKETGLLEHVDVGSRIILKCISKVTASVV